MGDKGSCMNADTTLLCAPNKSIHRILAMWIHVFENTTPAMGLASRPLVIAITHELIPLDY